MAAAAALEAMAAAAALRRAAGAGPRPRGIVTHTGPPRPRGPLPRTPWTTRGPPPEVLSRRAERRPVREQVELDTVTYEARQHRVPGLARPRFPAWQRGWHDPWHSPGPRYEDMALRKERGCFVCHQRVRMLEGTRSAWPAPLGAKIKEMCWVYRLKIHAENPCQAIEWSR